MHAGSSRAITNNAPPTYTMHVIPAIPGDNCPAFRRRPGIPLASASDILPVGEPIFFVTNNLELCSDTHTSLVPVKYSRAGMLQCSCVAEIDLESLSISQDASLKLLQSYRQPSTWAVPVVHVVIRYLSQNRRTFFIWREYPSHLHTYIIDPSSSHP